MAEVELTHVRKTFGKVTAVADMNLSINDGEFVAFLGPSGCGKTTTLRLISGLELPDRGTIRIGDRDVTQTPPRTRDIAMVFQDYALYPHMTVHDNIGYPLKVRGTDRKDINERVTSVARQLQIDALLDRRPAQLSGGQQQRAALARAVVHQAQLFLFDEPLSNLDAKLRLEARAFLKYLQQTVGVTAVYVTHDQAEAMALADQIVIMNEGLIMQKGTPREIYRTPANTFVASFIGSPPMNLIPCHVEDSRLTIDPQGAAQTIALDQPHSTDANTLGVRPEYISVHTETAADRIPAQKYVTQMLGSETLVMVRLGEHLITARLSGDEIPDYPEQVWLSFNQERLFFYGADGELIV